MPIPIPSNTVYGIDFGTTNTAASAARGRRQGAEILELDTSAANTSILRSVIYTNPQKVFLFGQQAVDAYLTDVAQGEKLTKKLVYTGKQIQIAQFSLSGYQGEKWFPVIMEIEEGTGGRLIQSLKTGLTSRSIREIMLFGERVELEKLLSTFLAEIKNRADTLTGEDVRSVVMGRPVHFVGHNDDLAQTRIRNAAKIAGFDQVEFEYEPVGAAAAYGAGFTGKPQTVFVFDFGGGTLDFTVVRFPERKILSTHGMPIGGDLLNSRIFDHKIAKYFGRNTRFGWSGQPLPNVIFEYLRSWYQISLLKKETFLDMFDQFRFRCSDPRTVDALESLVVNNLGFSLYEQIDRMKKELSAADQSHLSFHAKLIDIEEDMNREEFEWLIADDLEWIREGIAKTLRFAGLETAEVDKVITTGGSSLIPVVRKLLVSLFGEEKLVKQDSFTSVAQGLGILAGERFLINA